MTSTPPKINWHWLLALSIITLLAFALRWYYVSTALVLNPVRGDATQYFAYAWNLATHGVFARDAIGAALLHPDNYRDPGYPIFLAFWMKLLGTGDAWYAAVLLSQALLGALTVTIGTVLGKQWLPTGWAIAGGLLMAVWPHSIAINGFLLSETLFGFLCALGLLLFTRACARGNLSVAIIGGMVLGAAALTNAVLLPFGILLALFLAWRKFASPKLCIALAVGALLLPGVWAVRNTQIPTPIAGHSSSDRAIQNLVQGAWPNYHEAYRTSFFGNTKQRESARSTLNAIDEEYFALRDTPSEGARSILWRLNQHPWRYAVWYLFQKPQELWGWSVAIGQGDLYVYPTTNAPFQVSHPWIAMAAICRALNPFLMLLALASLPVAWLGRRQSDQERIHAARSSLVSVICLLVFVTLVYTTLQAEPRYSIPFRSFEILLAITTLRGVTGWVQSKRAVHPPQLIADERSTPPDHREATM